MLYSAFLLGLFGSVHCLAMCGPLVLAFGQTTKSTTYKLVQQYGRIMGYACLGMLMGVIGDSASLFNFQQKLSVIIGMVIIGFTLSAFLKKSASKFSIDKLLSKLQVWAMQNTKSVLLRFFVLGLINSLLPCGLLYIALGVSVTLHSVQDSVLYMILFGVGTLPSMVLVLVFGNKVGQYFRGVQSKVLPVLSLLIGTMMVIRGLGLGIPYVSPTYNSTTQTIECCTDETKACGER